MKPKRQKMWFKIVVYIMLISMLLSTVVMSLNFVF
ncbi:stressosome-associated protein Prli42 [Paenibacillus sp. N1-5-1-14]|nr:stressosome-associated protein Prli42 [Paenibacillus radicibacter]MCR8642384.1 stressosome-associated protein Prli42 [Paenibacillus radicibacter]